jgi:hypothetical protein
VEETDELEFTEDELELFPPFAEDEELVVDALDDE